LSKTYPYRYKVGISGTFDARVQSVRASVSGVVGKPVHIAAAFKVPLFFAAANERAIHKCLLWWRAQIAPGSSGYTEWSWSINVYTALIVWLACYAYDAPRWLSLVVMFLPLPVDLILFTILLALVQYTLAGLMLYGFICFSSNVLWNIFF
jgi:hypothetical protein